MDACVDRRKTTLNNGARVITVRLPSVHRASVVVYARVGARYETKTTSGLSHLVEHMIFRGSSRLPNATRYAAAMERIGGSLNAETGIDYSLYQVSVPPSEVEGAIELLGDVFEAPQFADLDVEKRIIREEILEDLDESGHDINVDNLARTTAWKGHPLGFRITGTLQNVERFDIDDVRAHFRRFYGARNLIVCASGAVEHASVLSAARRSFGRIPPGQPAQARPPTNSVGTTRVSAVHSAGSQTSVEALLKALPETDPGYPALVCLIRIIDDGLSTRLHRRVVDELGLAYYVSAGLEAYEDAGAVEIQAQVAHESAPRMVQEILALFDDLRCRPVDAEELDKAKRRHRWDLEASVDDPDAMAGWFGGGELFRRAERLEQRSQRIFSVSEADVLRVAQRVFDRTRLTVAAVGDLRGGRLGKIRRIVDAYR